MVICFFDTLWRNHLAPFMEGPGMFFSIPNGESWWISILIIKIYWTLWPTLSFMARLVNQPPPNVPPPRNKDLIRPYWGKPMVHKPLIFWGGGTLGGGWLTSHYFFNNINKTRCFKSHMVLLWVQPKLEDAGTYGPSTTCLHWVWC